MSEGKIVQLKGGDRESQDLYIGAPRELTVDTTNDDLRLHDGTTPGGKRIMSMENGDERYQAKSPELDGLTGFAPTSLGILSRVGPADYEFRALTGDDDNIEIDFPRGLEGDPVIRLKAVITSSHTFAESQTFQDLIIAEGGVQGDLLGNVQGDLLGNTEGTHTGNVIGNLTGNASGDHTGSFAGDVDTRGYTLLVDDGAIQLPALGNTVTEFLGLIAPRGMIVMWSGLIDAIPPGWLLCDGTGGTPDLRDRFIVGAGGTYLEGETGGAHPSNLDVTTATGGSHTHPVTIGGTALTVAQLPAHAHGNGVADDNVDSVMWRGTNVIGRTGGLQSNSGPGKGAIEGVTEDVGDGEAHTHTASISSSGTHDHAVEIIDADLRPPYYALAYIMKDF